MDSAGFTLSALLVLRLIQFHLHVTRHSKVSQQPPLFIADARREFNATRFQFFNRFLAVIATLHRILWSGRAAGCLGENLSSLLIARRIVSGFFEKENLNLSLP